MCFRFQRTIVLDYRSSLGYGKADRELLRHGQSVDPCKPFSVKDYPEFESLVAL
jgi:hypothetical protein